MRFASLENESSAPEVGRAPPQETNDAWRANRSDLYFAGCLVRSKVRFRASIGVSTEEIVDQSGLYRAGPTRATSAADPVAKRFADGLVAALLIVVLSPLLLVVALAIWLNSGLPIIYRCERLGRGGRRITVLKFRTMRDGSHHHLRDLLDADERRALEYDVARKLRRDPRRTRVGMLLRRTSMDELPQLVNVLMGDMSLVGPRPYFAEELLHRAEAAEILSVRPGITGLWQINGRSDRTFEERIAFDLEYVRNRSGWLESRILLATVFAVVTGRGAY